jgi:hypothetical protein
MPLRASRSGRSPHAPNKGGRNLKPPALVFDYEGIGTHPGGHPAHHDQRPHVLAAREPNPNRAAAGGHVAASVWVREIHTASMANTAVIATRVIRGIMLHLHLR